MKKVVKGFASVILASMIFVVGCKPPTSTSEPTGQSKITVTVQGDEHVDNIITKTLSVVKGSTWSTIKSKITVTCKNGFVKAGWKLDNASGTDLTDGYRFEQDTTVYVLSKNTVTVGVQGDERINLQQPIEKPYGTAWSSIKAEIERNIQPSADWKDDWNKGDYAFYEWRLDNENGKKISDDYRFTDNTIVYAVSNYAKWKIASNELLGYDGDKPRGKIIIPEGVKSIGDSTFSECDSLTTIEIPAGVTSIGTGAFSGCTSLESIEIPASVESIRDFTFEGCTSLASITIPKSVTSIGDSAFEGCTGLTSIKLSKGLTSIGGSAFTRCTSLESITIPESVTSIGKSAFAHCTNLASIEIPASVTEIEVSAVSGCSSLKSIKIPAGVTSIKGSAFKGCPSLKTIEIPASVTSIGVQAFNYCRSLDSAIFKAPEGWKDSSGNPVDVSTTKKAIKALKDGNIHK